MAKIAEVVDFEGIVALAAILIKKKNKIIVL